MSEEIKIKDHDIIFEYLDDKPINGERSKVDSYRALFIIDNKYKVYFRISGTEYCSDITNSGKSTADYIIEKYGNIKNCFKKIGVEYLKEKISHNDLKDEILSLIEYLD